jgi:hypothetical protein
MTSFRQIEANRRNARLSTRSVTEEIKRRSQQNAVRHELTAETGGRNLAPTPEQPPCHSVNSHKGARFFSRCL